MTTTVPDAPPATPIPEAITSRWQPLRAGLQNIWQYDHTTRFVFHHGRLLLRGRNGAGKTKVIEVLLPFLLEGRLEPSRLDPFGTRSRRMHYNLLHPDNRNLTASVGYVWLEFGRVDEDVGPRYVTIGAGLKARRTSDAVESWFFVAHDRRVDVDLDLLDDDRRPLGRTWLAEALGDDGRVCQSAGEHRAAVNRALFGLEGNQYEALLEAMLRLRQPHLSERLDPPEVGAVLSDSLPPLDPEKVHDVAEGFERLEAHRRDLHDRRRTLAAVEEFLGSYGKYANTIAAVRARNLTRADSQVRAAAERATRAERAHEQAEERASQLAERVTGAEAGLDAARIRIHTLETSDEYRAVQQLEEAESTEARDHRLLAAVEERHEQDTRAQVDAHSRVEDAAEEVANRDRESEEAAREATVRAAAAELRPEHDTLATQLSHALDGEGDLIPVRGTLASVHSSRRHSIAAVQAKVDVAASARTAERDTQRRLEDADASARDEQARMATAEDAVHAAVAAHREAVTAWAEACTVLRLNDASLAALLDRDPVETAPAARELARPIRDRLDTALGQAEAAARMVAEQSATVEAARDALVAATHQPPPSPAWRRAERGQLPGAPFYLLAELTSALDEQAHGPVEAALEAAGLLDAWVTPDGRLLDPDTFDAVVVPVPPPSGRTLADAARPTPQAVDSGVITAVLAGIGLVGAGEAPDPDVAAWVACDGRFRLGPLHGTARRAEVRYLGETARRRAREERLAELALQLDELRREHEQVCAAVAEARDRRRTLDAEVERLPRHDAVLAARTQATIAAERLEEARARVEACAAALAQARAARQQADAIRDATAAEHGLGAYLDRLGELAAATEAWRDAVRDWLAAATILVAERCRLTDLDRAWRAARARVERTSSELDEARRAVARSAERVRTLREALGSTRDELLAALAEARADSERLEGELKRLRVEEKEAAHALGSAEQERTVARAAQAEAETSRETAAASFRALAALGVLQQLLPNLPVEDPERWSIRTALEQARRAAKHGPALPDDPEAIENLLSSARNTLARRQQELLRDLVAGIRLFPSDHRGVVVYEAQHQGRSYRLDTLVVELREDVAERDARLHRDEQELLESFLAGELHEHLRSRIRDATELVAVMNTQLTRCPTAAGQRLRLQWRVSENAPAGTEQAVHLLLRGSGLLTDDQRGQLRAYLHERLRAAREGEAAARLFDRIGEAFDYRRWHTFTVEFRDPASGSWRRLTRQTHGTGSGGEKAVMLHLPLFAAMAAHYHTSRNAPRLIVLDEVFAGIDRGTRGQLMGLLVELDLDALLTSHEEWGFYRELDGISTYHLIREPEVPGVLAEWFVWDGATRWEMS